ncbi:MAG: sulfatase-like hydrolase/transferase [Oscillibacter sp.]|nr:sulfatase-like hydrolase/transferase [Oscillibacter sp.]
MEEIELYLSDVSRADFKSFDVFAFGVQTGHCEFKDIIPDGEYETMSVGLSDDGEGVTIIFDNPTASNGISILFDFLPIWFWVAYWAVFLLISLLVSCGASFLLERFPVVRLPLFSASGIMAVMIMGCWFCGSLAYVDYLDFLLNWMILFSIALLLNAFTLPFLGTVLTMAVTIFWYAANNFVIMFRNKPIMPADLKALGTVKEVIGGYTLTPTPKMAIGILVTVLYMCGVVYAWKQSRKTDVSRKKQWIRRGASAGIGALLLFVSIHNPEFRALNSFQWDNMLLKCFHEEGMVVSFIKSAMSATVSVPDGYSPEIVRSYLEAYEQEDAEPVPDAPRPVNIIMVMNEAFSDLRTVGLNENLDVMPFIDSLRENTVQGNLYVSVYGGGTCNTEFEALTGNSLAFFNAGAYPYTENVTKPLFSLASYFRDSGYKTDAFHANNPKNWNRNIVYPNLGFETFHSIGDYLTLTENPNLHEHPADISDYLNMERVSESYRGQNRFLFNVTMQNHSPYNRWEDVQEAESVTEYGAELYFDTKVYLSLVKASDDAVQQLVETYRDSDEPTMIIFFGDHQPSLPYGALVEMAFKQQLDAYQTKFFVWTNYETAAESDVQISANYLPWLILERGNFPLPPYVRMLKEVHEKYPVISSQGVVDADGAVYGSVAELADDPLIQKYQYVQYANLFDELDAAWFTP